MARVLVPLAGGFEEIETSTIVDVLRRGGIEVVVAGLDGTGPCIGSRGMTFVADVALTSAEGPWDMIVLPGGMKGAEKLATDERVLALLQTQKREKRPIAAICAAPLALDAAGVLAPGLFTCYPGIEKRLKTPGRRNDPVVDHEGLLITSQGPGTAMKFALHLVARLAGEETRDTVARALLFPVY